MSQKVSMMDSKLVSVCSVALVVVVVSISIINSMPGSDRSDPRAFVQLPGPNYQHVNPCSYDPRNLAAFHGRVPYVAVSAGEIADIYGDTLLEQIMTDVLVIQARCDNVQLLPGVRISRTDGSDAYTFHSRPGSTDTPISFAYYVRKGKLYRANMWVAPEGDLSKAAEKFESLVADGFAIWP